MKPGGDIPSHSRFLYGIVHYFLGLPKNPYLSTGRFTDMSSFFDNTKIVGFAFVMVAVILVADAILTIVLGFMDVSDDLKEGIDNWMLYCVIGGIGSLICAALYGFFANKVYVGTYSEKIVILTTALGGIFNAVASIAGGQDIGAAIVSAIILVLIGLLIMFISTKINDGKQTVGDKIIWIILLIAFILMIIGSALSMVSLIGVVDGIAHILIGIFMIAFLFDSEVKSKMNM